MLFYHMWHKNLCKSNNKEHNSLVGQSLVMSMNLDYNGKISFYSNLVKVKSFISVLVALQFKFYKMFFP